MQCGTLQLMNTCMQQIAGVWMADPPLWQVAAPHSRRQAARQHWAQREDCSAAALCSGRQHLHCCMQQLGGQLCLPGSLACRLQQVARQRSAVCDCRPQQLGCGPPSCRRPADQSVLICWNRWLPALAALLQPALLHGHWWSAAFTADADRRMLAAAKQTSQAALCRVRLL